MWWTKFVQFRAVFTINDFKCELFKVKKVNYFTASFFTKFQNYKKSKFFKVNKKSNWWFYFENIFTNESQLEKGEQTPTSLKLQLLQINGGFEPFQIWNLIIAVLDIMQRIMAWNRVYKRLFMVMNRFLFYSN